MLIYKTIQNEVSFVNTIYKEQIMFKELNTVKE